MPDHFLLDTEPETAGKLREHLDHYIIADDVTLEDVTAGTATIAVEGPRAAELLAALGAPVPDAPYGHLAWGDRTVARVDSTGAGGCFLFLPAGGKMKLIRELEAGGITGAGAEDARVVRLEHGRPRYGEDITEDHVPQETQVLRAIHFNKGCYIGQEIVERIRSRGHVNRLLVRLAIDAAQSARERDRTARRRDHLRRIFPGAGQSGRARLRSRRCRRPRDRVSGGRRTGEGCLNCIQRSAKKWTPYPRSESRNRTRSRGSVTPRATTGLNCR